MATKRRRLEPGGGYETWIGRRVCKRSFKPFKSGDQVNTIAGVIQHPITLEKAFTFVEDDSHVECWTCKLVLEIP